MAHLQQQVEELTRDKNELKRVNEVMRAQMDLLEQTNRQLLINQLANGGGVGALGGGGVDLAGVGGLLGAAGLGTGGMLAGNTPAGFPGAAGPPTGVAVAPTLFDQLTMERIAAQNRFQALQQARLEGAVLVGGATDGANNSNTDNKNGNVSNSQNGY